MKRKRNNKSDEDSIYVTGLITAGAIISGYLLMVILNNLGLWVEN